MEDPTPTVDAPSKPPQRFRRVRIALSVFFDVLTVALVVLWIQSYTWIYQLEKKTRGGRLIQATFVSGRLELWVSSPPSGKTGQLLLKDLSIGGPFRSGSLIGGGGVALDGTGARQFAGFSVRQTKVSTSIRVPFWFVVAATVIAGVASVRFSSTRFSLRTMLIATTLVAVVLGLGVWLAK